MPTALAREFTSSAHVSDARVVPFKPLTILLAVPTLDAGAADHGVLEIVRVLAVAGHKPIVVSAGGRLVKDVLAARGEFIRLDIGSRNPVSIFRNALILARIVKDRGCDALHAHGRAPAWSAYLASRSTGVPLLTSWHKGFREQNVFKRAYNGVMARGERVIVASEQIAQLIHDRYGVAHDSISIIPGSVDLERFDIAKMTPERLDAVRTAWGVRRDTKVILVTGRMLRRKGHHTVVRAVERLKNAGMKDFLCVFVGEDSGHSHYTGELWDLILSTGTAGQIRMGGGCGDLPAAYAACSVVVSAAMQPEGMQRAIIEAQAMARPIVISDMGAGADVVLSQPSVPEHRITGLRFSAENDAALADTLMRLFALPQATRNAIGARGREWALDHFNRDDVASQILGVYASVVRKDP